MGASLFAFFLDPTEPRSSLHIVSSITPDQLLYYRAFGYEMARTKPRAKRPRTNREPSESTALLGGREGASPAVSYTSSVTSHASSGHAADDIPASEIPSATDGDDETLDRGAILRIVLILLIGN